MTIWASDSLTSHLLSFLLYFVLCIVYIPSSHLQSKVCDDNFNIETHLFMGPSSQNRDEALSLVRSYREASRSQSWRLLSSAPRWRMSA